MKRWYGRITPVLLMLVLCGCVPRRIFWSPDGQYAAIIAEDGLRICDAAGRLSDVVAKDGRLVAWFPDSHRFVAARTTRAAKWEEAAVFLNPDRRDALLKLVDPLCGEALAHSGDWNNFEPKAAAEMSDGELAALLLYIRDHRREGLPEKLGAKWKDIEKMEIDVHLLEVYEITGVGATPIQVLSRTVDAIEELRISPNGRGLACVQKIFGRGDNLVYRLSVLPPSGGMLRTAAEPVALFPDWSTDSRSLVYAATRTPAKLSGPLQLGTIVRRSVCDESGELLKEINSPEEDLAGVIFGPFMKIRCLPDGRIIFSTMEVTLPSTSKDMPQYASLFSIDPDKQPTVTRIVPRDTEANLPDGLAAGCFEVSPDATRIVVSSVNDNAPNKVSILTLATGMVQSVVDQGGEVKSMPAWRTAQVLSFAVPPKSQWGSTDRCELVLWSGPGQARCLSRNWPDIFTEKTPASQPMSAPVGD